MDVPRPSVWGPQPEFDMGVGNFVIARLRLKAVSVWRACTARLKGCLSNSGCGSKLALHGLVIEEVRERNQVERSCVYGA
jgi:hypothetical protein